MANLSDKPLAVVTGATGHIGFRTLAALLEAGYRARVTSRRLSSAERLKNLSSIRPYADSLESAEVPDMLAEDAFDEAVQGVDYILHLASPIPDWSLAGTEYDLDDMFLKPAIQGTLGILKAAAKEPSVKRVVITASLAILAPKDGKSAVGPNHLAQAPSREAMEKNIALAYRGSKVLAYQAAEEFIANNQPTYDVVYILPAYVQGRNETVATADGLLDRVSSNGDMLRYVLGDSAAHPHPTDMVFVDDVAAVEVAALDPKKAGHAERFIAAPPTSIGNSYSVIDPLVKKLFPDAVQKGLLPLGGNYPGIGYDYDSSKTTQMMGVEFHGLETMVESLIGQYVELAGQ